jgi:alkylresorcinol/alkylpyrone synthase
MPRLAGFGTANPPHAVDQRWAQSLAEAVLARESPELARMTAVFEHSGVRTRYLARPLEWYLEPRGWRERTSAFIECGLELLERAALRALDAAGVDRSGVDGIVLVTSTGLSTPSLEARLANRLRLRPDLVRVPVWGLGCAGGVAGLARAADLAAARPRGRFLVLALELCSLAFLRTRVEKKAIVAASLFGDGCAAVLVEGDAVADASRPRWAGAASHQWPDTEYVMGWDVLDEGLDVVFDPVIPAFVRSHIRAPLDGFLSGRAVDAYALHPGGAKVLDAFESALGLGRETLAASRDVLREYGNMSSPTVLYVLDRILHNGHRPRRIVASALGPGFASEMALIEGAEAA